MRKIKDIFLGQLGDSLNERFLNTFKGNQKQKEVSKETINEEKILAIQKNKLTLKPKKPLSENSLFINKSGSPSDFNDAVVGK